MHASWRSAVSTSTSSGSQFARRPPTPHPARPNNSRGLQDYDDLPWLLSPTRRGILSDEVGARAPTADYAGALGPQPSSSRMYTARLSTLEPYVPQRLVFTPAPEQGWDTIHRNDPEELLASVDREKLPGLLEEDAECTVMVQIYNLHNPSTAQIREITENLTLLTREITGETTFKIIPPEAARNDESSPRHATPVWPIVRLSREGARALIEGQVYSAPLITALTSPRPPRLGRFLFNLGGFGHDDDGDIIRTVWETFNGPQILPNIMRLARGNPAFSNVSPEEAASVILASLEVQVSTLDNGNLVAAVFCDSPTASLPLWRQWRDGMLGIRFRSLFNSTATARRATRCAGCHSASHLTHLCPFPMVPGWNAAPPTDREQTTLQRPTTGGQSTAQGDPNAPARFGRNPRGRGASANRAATRRRQPERRSDRDGYERNGYDGHDAFGGDSHDGKSGFGRDEYM